MKRYLLFISIIIFLFSSFNKARAQTITAGIVTGTISACAGSASASPYIQQFIVSGNNLTGNVTATAPAGFEVSLSPGSGYGISVTLPQTGGTVNGTIVYVRSSALALAGIVAGNLTLTSGAATQNVAVAGVVSALVSVNVPGNQTVSNGVATAAVNFMGTGSVFNWVNNTPGIGLAASGTGNIASFTAINTGNAPVTATITVTPIPSSFAYISAYIGSTLTVVNLITNTVVATMPVGSTPDAVAISPDNKWVYVANFGSNSISVVSTATNTVTGTIAVTGPWGVAVSPDGSTLYVTNFSFSTVTVINTTTYAVKATIPAGGDPYEIVLSPDGSRMYVTNFSTSNVSVINTATNMLIATIPVGPTPCNLSMSPDGSRLYVLDAGSHSLVMINTITNAIIRTISVGTKPIGIAVSPDGSRIYVTDQQASVFVIDAATGILIANIITGSTPTGVSLSPDGSLLYIADFNDGTLSVINTSTNAVLKTILLPSGTPLNGSFVSHGSTCSGTSITFTITVNPTLPPAITVSSATGIIDACAGTASDSPDIQQFTVSGSNLTAGITAKAPAGFEISLNQAAGFGSTITLTQAGGTVNSTVVYIRSAASAAAGNISGNVTLTSGPAAQTVAVNGLVNASPTVNAIANQTVYNGATTTAINFTGTGNTFAWVNNTPGIGLGANGTGNIAPFTAVNTSGRPITATIIVTPISATCSGLPATFTIKVNSPPSTAKPVIPNTFTPNGDGVNDTWNIKNLDTYPNCIVQVYNRYGENVYSSIGYGVAWDGTYNGAALPVGTYYYLIDLKNGSQLLSGFVAIIR